MYNSQNIQISLSQLQNAQVRNTENREGFYRAIVISNKDPYNIARVKIRIPSFHGTSSAQTFYVDDNNLPWAWPGAFLGSNYQSGQYILPLEGSTVWVSFETGTSNFIYFGSLYSSAPNSEKYVYFDRGVNRGEPLLVEGDDIPSDYNSNKYIIYRSPKGSCIYIDDRDSSECIVIEDSHGNKVTMNGFGIALESANYLKANFPYYKTYYVSKSKVSNDVELVLKLEDIYEDAKLTVKASNITIGSRLIYVNSNKVAGSGIITENSQNLIVVSNNGLS